MTFHLPKEGRNPARAFPSSGTRTTRRDQEAGVAHKPRHHKPVMGSATDHSNLAGGAGKFKRSL